MGSQGPTELRVGDSVRFIITLTRDGNYKSIKSIVFCSAVFSCMLKLHEFAFQVHVETS